MRKGTNIRTISSLKPDYMGLIFYPKSPRYVDDKKASAVANAFPKKTKRIGVFVNEEMRIVFDTTLAFKLDLIQLHGSESPEYCREMKEMGFSLIKAFGVGDNFDFKQLEAYKPYCDYFLFDTKSDKHGGTGKKFDWTLLQKYDNEIPIFLSGGIGPEDVEAIQKIENLNIHALDINSRFETEPGIKDYELLKIFIDKIRN